jgi:GNAT superfamily N-acetyltransferase
MVSKRQHYPMSEPVVKRQAENAAERNAGSLSNSAAFSGATFSGGVALVTEVSPAGSGDVVSGSADPGQRPALVFRLLNYKDIGEVRAFITLLYAISAEADPFHFDKEPEFIDRLVLKALREENPTNTFAAVALERREIVAVHVLRRFEEGPLVGAQVAGLWVAERYRRRGVARQLKAMGEDWARSIGAHFLNTNVLSQNAAMLDFNRQLGFENYRVNLRKRL